MSQSTGEPNHSPKRRRLLWLLVVIAVALAPLAVIYGTVGEWARLSYTGQVAAVSFWILVIPVMLLWIFADK